MFKHARDLIERVSSNKKKKKKERNMFRNIWKLIKIERVENSKTWKVIKIQNEQSVE